MSTVLMMLLVLAAPRTHAAWASLAARASQPGPMGGAGRPNVGLHSRGREDWRAWGGQCLGGSMDPVVAGR